MRWLVAVVMVVSLAGCTCNDTAKDKPLNKGEISMNVYYLEIVTTDADAVCAAYTAADGLTFSEPQPELGNARTATLPGGGILGVRAPMHAEEAPVIRPYFLVDDIDAAVAAAEAAGAQIALPPMEIPGRGKCAIYFLGGTQHGLWQLN